MEREHKQILKVLAGSRAYGLDEPDSDYDYRGVFEVPARLLMSVGLGKIKETQWIEGKEDDVAWELAHFCSLALHCNPNVLEVFVSPIVDSSPEGEQLRDLFPAFVSRKRVYDAWRGYSKNQRNKMFEPSGGVLAGERSWKFGANYLRTLYQGAQLLHRGPRYWSVNIEHEATRNYLLSVKHGEVGKGAVITRAEELESGLTDAYLNSTMQEEPNLNAVNDFIFEVRKNSFLNQE